MKQTQTITRNDVLTAAENYLKARQNTGEGYTIGMFLNNLYDSSCRVSEEDIEQSSILITEALAAFNSEYVHKTLMDETGEHWISRFCNFLSNLNKALLYTGSCKTAITSADVCYLNESETPDHWSQEVMNRIKREYEIRLQRLQDDEDFE